jgi:ankyrin repeat protein
LELAVFTQVANGGNNHIPNKNETAIDMVSLLLQYPGIDINAVDDAGHTTLTVALLMNHNACAVLTKHGARFPEKYPAQDMLDIYTKMRYNPPRKNS